MKARPNPTRPAIEAALTETWRAAIDEFCAKFGIPRDRWDSVPGLRVTAEVVALYRRVDELCAKHEYGNERALLEASAELGLNGDTVSRRLRAWIRSVWKDEAA